MKILSVVFLVILGTMWASEVSATPSSEYYPERGGYPGNQYPGNGYPGNGNPGNGYPGNGYPGNGYPGNGYPGNGYPGNGYPGEGGRSRSCSGEEYGRGGPIECRSYSESVEEYPGRGGYNGY